MVDRIQRRRVRGWRMPAGAVYVGRPSEWGNPYVVHEHTEACGDEHFGCPEDTADSPADAVAMYRRAVLWPVVSQPNVPTPDEIRAELAGRDLACWCALDQPCHADVLLTIANEEVHRG